MDILIFTLKSVSLFDISNRFWYHMKRSVTKNNLTLKDILMITLDSVPLFDISNRFWYRMKRSFTNTMSTHRIFKQHHLHSFDGRKWWNRTSFSYTMTVALKELTKKPLKCCRTKYVKEIKVCWRMRAWSFVLFFFLFLFFFDLGFTALSRIFHLYRADRSSKVGENRRTRRKTTWPSVSRTWLSHIWPEPGSNHSGEKPNGSRVNSLIH